MTLLDEVSAQAIQLRDAQMMALLPTDNLALTLPAFEYDQLIDEMREWAYQTIGLHYEGTGMTLHGVRIQRWSA